MPVKKDRSEWGKNYYRKNRERILARQKRNATPERKRRKALVGHLRYIKNKEEGKKKLLSPERREERKQYQKQYNVLWRKDPKNLLAEKIRHKTWYQMNKEKIKQKASSPESLEQRRKYYRTASGRRNALKQLLKKRHWKLEEYERVWKEQRGLCAITSCGNPAHGADHDHSLLLPRAILCRQCNSSLGFVKDRPEVLRELAEYLEIWKSKHLTQKAWERR